MKVIRKTSHQDVLPKSTSSWETEVSGWSLTCSEVCCGGVVNERSCVAVGASTWSSDSNSESVVSNK